MDRRTLSDECVPGESFVRDEWEPVVAEAEKLSVGLSQLAGHAAESQMNVEISVGTPKGTARGGRANLLDPRFLLSTWSILV